MVESDINIDKVRGDGDDSTTNGVSDLEGKIIRQVEYYFGDFNLLKDKFLQEQIKEDDGWVPLSTLLKFNRLASLSKETDVIVNALEKSSSGLLEINEAKDKIRRSPHVPIPEMNEERRKELMERTVYCKGLPLDSKLNDILEFFYKFEEIENVTMRSWHDKATKEWNFKGSVFIIFKTVEGADKFLKLESVKYNDSGEELIRKWQKDYIEEKRKERLEVRMKHSKKSKGQENKKSKGDGEDRSEGKEGSGDEDEEEEKEDSDGFATGTVVALKGLDSSIKWDSIKERIEEMGLPVAFIEYTLGDEVAFVRLVNKDSASELAKLVAKEDHDNKIKIGDKELSLRVVEGEEEKTFLEKQKAELMKKRNAAQRRRGMNKKGRAARGRNRGKWDNRKRRGSSPSGEPASKVRAN